MVNNDTSMALFLSQKMGLQIKPDEYGVWLADDDCRPFDPATNKAQLMEVILWAAKDGVCVRIGYGSALADNLVEAIVSGSGLSVEFPHDNTDASIMRATVEAIARALGWEPSHE